MARSTIPRLGYALLGLLSQQPSSGYDIRKIFTQTPMGSFSDSPGAIYPALRRLEAQNLVRGQVSSSGLRQRKIFRLTPAGATAFKQWLKRPVKGDDLVRRMDDLLLRFSFMHRALGEAGAVRFLKALREELTAYVPFLRGYYNSHKAELAPSEHLALESGVRQYETLLRWSEHALATYGSKS